MNFRLVTQSGVVGVSIFNRAFLKNQLSQVLSKLPPKDEAPSDMKPILEMFEKMAED